MSVVVRPATEDDIDAAVDLYALVAEEGRWIAGEAPTDKIERRARFESSIRREDAQFFVAEDGSRIVGELGIEVAGYGVADFGMMVASDARGRGVGAALMAVAIDWAREAGAHKIALQVWPHNEAAIALYRKFGFEQEGYLRRHYRRRSGELWDAVVMGLVL
ncbi:MAG TPA: GNAT family N-acetyltransferase [Acidimicrobiales bacterium]|nr:GNAT family N-acetyltransferase [Acidimicrobiales bacterium]